MEKQMLPHVARARVALTWAATVFCCAAVATIIWFQERVMTDHLTFLMGFVIAFQINFFEFVYNIIVEYLLEFENQKYQANYYNSYVRKQIIFQSVNNYFPFILVLINAAEEQIQEPAPEQKRGDCLHEIRWELSMALSILSLSRIAHVGISLLKTKAKLWYRGRVLARGSKVSYAEEQSGYAEFNAKEHVWTMLHPVISLGHVLLFGVAAPVVVPLCLIVFIMARSTTAFLLTNYAKRPFPRDSAGITGWQGAVWALTRLGALSTGCLLVFFGESFQGTPLLTRSWGLLLFITATVGLWALVDFCYPPSDGAADLLIERRRRVERAVMHAGMVMQRNFLPTAPTGSEPSAIVDRGDWQKLPCLEDPDSGEDSQDDD